MPLPSVAINARAAIRTEIGGVERVAREMVARLPRTTPGRYRVVEPPERLAHRAGHLWEQAWLPMQKAELIYSPANLAPVASRRNVVVIHDVAALRHPEWYSRAYVAWQRALLPRIAHNARLVITVSEFSRQEIEDVLQTEATVIPNGVDDRFKPSDERGDYALVVGTRIARKNLKALEATATALNTHGIELRAAGSGRGYMRAESTTIRQLGYVRDEDLPSLYAKARVLINPSLYEGFGLPCLEAMASGTPVVAANRGALPETCGDAALLVEPDEIAEAAVTAALDEPTRTRLVEKGLARAARFNWERTARETDQAIGRLLTWRRS
jgi:glycosyltransferase involved in cell wall biosynthesis